MRYGSTEGTREHVGTRSRKIARKASARLNVLLRGLPNYSHHHKSGGRVNHAFRMLFHGRVTIRDVIKHLM